MFSQIITDNEILEFRIKVNDMLISELSSTNTGFTSLWKTLEKNKTQSNFGTIFVSVECFAYLALFDSIRNRNWNLRIASLKLMGPLFSAMDRQTYQVLIPTHLLDLAKLPPSLQKHFEDGAFSARLSTTDWHVVAPDECHEMQINTKMLKWLLPDLVNRK